jgi:hypothetical protein
MAENPIQEVREACESFQPQIVGVSLRNLDTARFHYEDAGEKTFLDELLELIKATRVNRPLIALGGSGFSIAPHQIIDLTGAEVGFIGPSEFDFAEFCVRIIERKLDIREATHNLPSIVMPQDSSHLLQVTELGAPNQLDLTAVEYAKLTGGTVPLRTKTGCSMKCSYCVVPSVERLILRPWKDIHKELDWILEAGLGDRVFIADGEFNLPSIQRAIELCHLISSEFGTDIKWTCYLEAGYITPELLGAMREAGCICISLTADSFSRETRIGYIKGTKPEVAIKATKDCLDSGIHTNLNLLFGGPNETLETAASTAKIAREFNRNGLEVSVTIGLRVYPNTPLSRMVTMNKYSRHFQPCSRFNWLGLFCSPVRAKELAAHILPSLPPSSTVLYTNAKTVEEQERSFYHQVTIGANLLVKGRLEEARAHFTKLAAVEPTYLEIQHGILTQILDQLAKDN